MEIVYEKNKIKNNGSFLVLDYNFNENITSARLGISISSKIAKANERNKFKRQIREIFRLNQHSLYNNLELVVLLKRYSKNLKYNDLENDFLSLISFIKNDPILKI